MTTLLAYDPLRDSRHREAAAARELSDWLQWLELGNKAARTLDTYERVCAALLRAFPHKTFDEFSDGDIMHVLAQYPKDSRATNKAALNSWFKWGYKTRRIPGNPVDLLPTIVYRPNRSYDLYGKAEADALCALPSPDGQLLTLMFWGGLRRGECIGMTGKRLALDQDVPQIVVVEGAKGGKPRNVPLTDRGATAAAELLTLEGIGPDDYLWYSTPGGKLRRSAPISNARFDIWWRLVHTAAAVRKRRPHLARHTYATLIRQAGVPMEDIQQHLGHSSMATTSDTYVHSDFAARASRLRELVG